jgi:acyl-CoA dehydrogenase
MGLHDFGELVLEICRVPVENRLGEEGDSLAVAYSSSILDGRANLTAVALGIHRALVDESIAFTTQLYRSATPFASYKPSSRNSARCSRG